MSILLAFVKIVVNLFDMLRGFQEVNSKIDTKGNVVGKFKKSVVP